MRLRVWVWTRSALSLPGKRADLILVANNPLEDVGHVKNIDGVDASRPMAPSRKGCSKCLMTWLPPMSLQRTDFSEVPPLHGGRRSLVFRPI